MSETSETETEAQAKTQAPPQAPMPRYVALVATAWIGADGRRTLIAPGQPLPEEMSEHDRQQLIAAHAARDNQQAQRQQRQQAAERERTGAAFEAERAKAVAARQSAAAPAAPAKKKGATP